MAWALHDLGLCVTLYLSQSRVALYLSNGDEAGSYTRDQLEKLLFELELLPSTCRVRLFRYPRVRDLRSLGVIGQISKKILQDGVDIADLLMGPGDLWSAVLAHLIRRIPVVSTTIGCEGLEVIEGEHLVIADSPEQFTEKTVRLLSDRQLYSHISIHGRQLVEARYDWDKLAGRLMQVYAEMSEQLDL